MTNLTKSSKKTLNDHDIFVKGILSITELANQLLVYYLPKTL